MSHRNVLRSHVVVEPFSPTPTIHQKITKANIFKLHFQHQRQQNQKKVTILKEGLSSEIDDLEPKLYPQRWVQLAYLSLLALLSDWICFALAAVPSTFEKVYPGHSAAGIIDIFLYTNVVSCFIVTKAVAKFGLSKCIKFTSVLMTLGCFLRSGVTFFESDWSHLFQGSALDTITTPHIVPYWSLVAGTILVGFSQPFFQCTPPLLSAKWFASDERAKSTAVALNFNQIGIATAFIVGGSMVTSAVGLGQYLTLISLVSVILAIGTNLQFQEKPPTPPSASEIEKALKNEKEPPFLESVKKFFQTRGFGQPLVAFICSISVTNIVGTFIDDVLIRGGITDQLQIDLAGAGFEIAILVGGIIIGGFVDRTKEYKNITMYCLALSIFLCIPLGFTDYALGKEPILVLLSLFGLGFLLGPVQPINAELAVDVTYPSDETAVESVQQIGGNLFSALIIPLAEFASKQDFELLSKNDIFASDIRGDVILLSLLSMLSLAYYSTYDAPLLRTLADCGDDGSPVTSSSADPLY